MSFALAGCITGEGGTSLPNRAMQPLKRETVAQLEEKGMSQSSPMVVRLFKQESELEVWKPGKDGHYELFKVYPICRWSGELGPKIKQGDRQAPEGFYSITPGQMNPNSSYYLAFNLGPEGTRVKPGETPPLKSGFAGLYKMLDLPVVPIATDSGKLLPKKGAKHPGIVTSRFGDPIPPGLPRREAERRVWEAINALECR